MKNRPAVLICAGTALLVALIALVTDGVLLASFERIERSAVQQSLRQAQRAFAADLRQLEVSARDYAEWDDAYRYASDRNREFIASNFHKDSMQSMQVDVVLIVDRAGEELFCAFLEEDRGRFTSPAPRDLRKALHSRLAAMRSAAPQAAADRLVRLPPGLFAFATKDILRSDRTGPSGGTMIFLRRIEPDEIERLSETSQLPVEIVPLDERGWAAAELPAAARDWLRTGAASGVPLVAPLDERTIAASTVLRDLEHKPVAVLTTYIGRDVRNLGLRTTVSLTAIIASLVIACGVAALMVIARLERSHRARQAAEHRYRAVIAQLNDGVLLSEHDTGAIIEANPSFLHALGYEPEQIARMRATDVFVGAPSWSGRRSATDVGRASCEMKLRASDGRLADVEASFTTVELEGRKVDCIVARDISARKAAEHQVVENQRKLAHLAHHDPLTGLPNRLFLQQLIPEMLLRASARGEGMALLYVDVDHFKHINDSLGHSSGDQVLVSVARRLRNAIAAADLVVRMGGDEFVVVAGKIRDQAAARSIAERLMAALETPIRVDGRLIGLTASIGVSLYPRNGDDLESLLKHADMALYRAKERGRNAFQFFDTEMTQRVTERMLLEQALRHALGTEQLHLEYQPIVALADGALLGFEALLRWRHPELGPIAPGRFIPIAEQSGLIVELGESVLRLACAQIAQWSREGAPAVPVSINVSPRQLERDRFDYLVAAASREFGVSAQQLAFEITETALMQNAEAQLAALRGLRTRGSRVSIDDFGTGYSSLSYLKHLPIDTIKIDKAFVQDMTSDANDAAIVSAIVRMAGSLGLHTIAEGVETAEQVEALRRLGCRAAQGYYFGRPMPAEQCRALLDRAAPRSSLADTMKMRVKRALSL